MNNICAKCNVCSFMPPQIGPRELSLGDDNATVLVIDDARGEDDLLLGLERAALFLGKGVAFTYTSSIRCTHDALSNEQQEEALAKCSVWTNYLLGGRSLVVTTENGLHQMKVGEGKKAGDLFRNEQLGVVLVIHPLHSSFDVSTDSFYLAQIARAKKSAGVK